ncbi:VWA domain-containing protein [Granulicella arctica]|uniref:VWA domain-containing protein n=1 Tax=Granulicella arctica TaxID=940613 RepID=UPI0021DF6EBB|nr:VWA domain-containing protein [Granulicella arctica]
MMSPQTAATPLPLALSVPRRAVRLGLCCFLALLSSGLPIASADAQTPAATRQQQQSPANPPTDEAGPQTDNGSIILRKKKDADEPPPPAAPEAPKVKNPNNETYSLRVDVPIVNLDVNVVLDKTHQFVPGLKPANFLVLEDGVEQPVQNVRMSQTPITAVMLLEFASNSYRLIYDMRNASYSFFRSLRPDDYIAVITFDLRTHILTDFTNNKDIVAQSLQTLTIPGFSDTNTFDALYETLDRVSRIEGRKYIVMIGSGRDTFSKITLDKMLAKIKATPNVTIFTIGTGAFSNELYGGRGGMSGGIRDLNYLQAQNQLKTFASMTGGLSFSPIFEGALPDVFSQINDSIRNEYVLTYRPTNNKNDGSYRKVKVLLVDNEGHPLQMQDEKQKPLKYSVIARDGYRAKLPVE